MRTSEVKDDLLAFKPHIRPASLINFNVKDHPVGKELKDEIMFEWWNLSLWYYRLIKYHSEERQDKIEFAKRFYRENSIIYKLENILET